MNLRIQELAEQASHQSPDGYPVTIPYSKDFAEKFAELIVKECDRYARSAWEHGPLLGKDLLIHFGIEEPDDGDIKS